MRGAGRKDRALRADMLLDRRPAYGRSDQGIGAEVESPEVRIAPRVVGERLAKQVSACGQVLKFKFVVPTSSLIFDLQTTHVHIITVPICGNYR